VAREEADDVSPEAALLPIYLWRRRVGHGRTSPVISAPSGNLYRLRPDFIELMHGATIGLPPFTFFNEGAAANE
jgi:hypothetical protein